ncbi:MAG TPA: AAA family ATPase, partial [Chthonomonadaceae bacterium]|nr:AAA family ATPase [Chthonomonadaceae bacterium]
LALRKGAAVKVRSGKGWNVVSTAVLPFDSMFSQVADPIAAPIVLQVREQIRGWRFYDSFRADSDAPVRHPQLGTRTAALCHGGSDLAAALRTIQEIGDADGLRAAVGDAFPTARVCVAREPDGRFGLLFTQEGLLRPLSTAELSDGTLRYLLWIAALLTPRPPSLMVLNEPETSLHPDLLPALARLIARASERSQVWVVTHAQPLIAALASQAGCNSIALVKQLGQTHIDGQTLLTQPHWEWPD